MQDVARTALTTLQCHALDAQRPEPILADGQATTTLYALVEWLGAGTMPQPPQASMVTHIATRARAYDRVARDFIGRHPTATIVHIGGGFDHRFARIDNGRIRFLEIDLPDIIAWKRRLFPPTERYRLFPQSVFDHSWMEALPEGPVLLLAEGVFMYCTEREVRQLIEALIRRLPAFDLFCEVFQADWLQGWRKRMVDYKLQQELGFGTDAQFTFGLHRSEDMEAWAPGLRLVSDWSYFDADHPALGPLRWFRHWPAFRYIQWSVYYHYERPGPKPAEDN